MLESLSAPSMPQWVNDLLADLQSQLEEHTASNRTRVEYDEGKYVLTQFQQTPVVPPAYWQLGIVLGWCGKAVELLARRCRLDGVSVVPELPAPGAAIWRRLVRMFRAEVDSAVEESMITGVAWLVVSATSPAERAAGALPALVQAVTGLDGTGVWNSRLRQLDAFLHIQDRDELGNPTEFTLYVSGEIIRPGFMVHYRLNEFNSWQEVGFGWISEVPVEPMVYQPRAGRPFGQSRITKPMMSLQNQAVRALTRGEGHMDVYSFPETYFLGATDALFRNADGSVKSPWQVLIGRIKSVPDNTEALDPRLSRVEVKQFDGASPEPHLAWINMLAKAFCREASLPDTALAMTDLANPTSAEAYDASQYELIAEAEGATGDYTEAVANAAARLMRTAGITIPTNAQVLPVWHNPRFLSRSAEADAGVKTVSAVPWLAETRIGLELLGLTETQIELALTQRAAAVAELEQQKLTLALAGGSALPSWPPEIAGLNDGDSGG